MPNRIIKESICTREDIAGLSMGADGYKAIVFPENF